MKEGHLKFLNCPECKSDLKLLEVKTNENEGVFDLKEDILKEWAILDTFDMLSPTYDKPQTIETVKQWFNDADLSNIDVHYGYNGIEGRGKRP